MASIKQKINNLEFVKKHSSHPLWRSETILVLGAIILSVVSSLLKTKHENSKIAYYKNKNKTVRIVAAKASVSKNSILEKTMIYYKDYLTSNVTTNMVPASQYERVINRRLNNEIKKGDPILVSNLLGEGQNSLAKKIPAGKRFFNLQIKDKLVSNGWIKPNDHVDILSTITLPRRGETTFTILQDVTLVTVGKNSAWNNSNKMSGSDIGFFITPEQFEILSFAQGKGIFYLSLRNPEDNEIKLARKDFGSGGIDMEKFLDSQIIRKASGGGNLKINIGRRK